MASFEAPEAASAGGSAVASLAFSENGFWFAATWTGSPSAVIFDLRKEGDAAVAKVLEVGDANGPTLAWDYSAQFLAAASGSSIVVLAYNKSAKSWSETLKTSVEDAISVRWGEDAKTLAVLEKSGRLSLLGVKE